MACPLVRSRTFGACSSFSHCCARCATIVLHFSQTIYYRMWWLLPTVGLCGLLEIIGWSGRIWSSLNPPLISPFQMQYVHRHLYSMNEPFRPCYQNYGHDFGPHAIAGRQFRHPGPYHPQAWPAIQSPQSEVVYVSSTVSTTVIFT
jgi:hypothetical protein